MRIDDIKLPNQLILAPMAGITHMPFRILAREAGCGLVCSEMISSNGLYYGSEETRAMLVMADAERPVAVQLFGRHPEIMAEAAAMVEGMGADIVDVNFGCAVKKVIRTGAGAALMKDPDRAQRILAAMRKATRRPLTIKMRSGWEASGKQALELSRIAEGCGVDAVSIHARTAAQGFKGSADWGLIERIKAAVSIPVIGNGDIKRPSDALKMLESTHCDGVMIGRAAIGNPGFFSQALAAINHEPIPRVDPMERFDLMYRYTDQMIALFGEKKACRMLRSRLGWFSRGLAASSVFRRAATRIDSRQTAEALIDAYRDRLAAAQKNSA
ncbi:MAG: tRNA dihydrouridine synthase DusB [Desulfobacterales bacterium]|nr:tRNA dihydrouridine synthase DusB [Desulfobacterales bacterium]